MDGFRLKFRQTKCENGETPTQFVVRLSMYLSRWSELAQCENDYTKMYEMILKEQFLSTREKDLFTHLREKPHATIDELTQIAGAYLEARSRTLYVPECRTHDRGKSCHVCGKSGHGAWECRQRVCAECKLQGHDAENCKRVGQSDRQPYQNKDKLKPREASNNIKSENKFDPRGSKGCFLCGVKGHFARDCRAIQRPLGQQAGGVQSVTETRNKRQ